MNAYYWHIRSLHWLLQYTGINSAQVLPTLVMLLNIRFLHIFKLGK